MGEKIQLPKKKNLQFSLIFFHCKNTMHKQGTTKQFERSSMEILKYSHHNKVVYQVHTYFPNLVYIRKS